MKLTSLLFSGCLAGLFALSLATQAKAQLSFSYTSFDPPGTISIAWGINNTGTIVGEMLDNDGMTIDGYISNNGQYSKFNYLNFLPGSTTVLYSVNSSGVMTGAYESPSGVDSYFIYNNGTFLSPVHTGATSTGFNKINDAGQVATVWTDMMGVAHSSIYDLNTNTFTDLPDANSIGTYAQVVGPGGQVLVNVDNATGGLDAATYSNGVYTYNNYPGAQRTALDDINQYGMKAGNYVKNGVHHGLVYYQNNFYSLDYPGATATYLYSINNSNQMVGYYLDADGAPHSLLVQATPEPSAMALLIGSAMTGVGFYLRRRS